MVLGLDFGTHQSKVCLENDSDPRDIRHTFQEFVKPDGGASLFLPSVVQINTDDTISYGFCDPSRAKETGFEYLLTKPEKQEVAKPVEIPTPPEPFKKGYMPESVFLNSFIQKKNKAFGKKKKKHPVLTLETLPEELKQEAKLGYLEYKGSVDKANQEKLDTWKDLVGRIEAKNKKNQAEYEASLERAECKYQEDIRNWENSRRVKYATYRYFKISTFSREYPWSEEISAKELSIWYLTYLLFLVRERFDNFSRVQMGIPQSIRDTQLSAWQTQSAKDIFYAAWDLMEKTGDIRSFLSLHVQDLKDKARTFGVCREDCQNAPGLLVLPEAFASLESITSQGKLKQAGLHLLVDIGGGSTDISLFYVTNKNQPNISAIVSVHKGLNYIFRLYQQSHLELSIEQIRAQFNKTPEMFSLCIQKFFFEISTAVHDNIYTPLSDVTLAANLRLDRLKDALMNRPVIYTGGGGVYETFHRGVHYFQDPLSISKDLLSIRNITNKSISQAELGILTVAYGLSIPQRRSPDMVPIDEFFSGVMGEKRQETPDYGVDDID